MAKNIFYVCSNCGDKKGKWSGRCVVCGEWNTIEEEFVLEQTRNAIDKISQTSNKAIEISKIKVTKESRIKTGFNELDNVLGGGLVSGEVLLVSGEPGIGKSTIMMQILSNISKVGKVLYVSGEESEIQLGIRAKRVLGESVSNFEILSNGNFETIYNTIQNSKYSIILVDSIQTVWDSSMSALPGSISQIKSVSSRLVQIAKTTNTVIIIIGHINKEGNIAGPKHLEHLVDCVLQIEGHERQEFRIIRSLKNRYGASGEVGLLKMTDKGLKDFETRDLFSIDLKIDREVGLAKTIILEGRRTLAIDIQSLVTKTSFSFPQRIAEGFSSQKLNVILALLTNKKIVNFFNYDVYVKTSGSYSIKDYSYADLAVVASIVSCKKNIPINQNLFFLGECSLNGRIFTPQSMEKHVDDILRIFPNSIVVSSLKADNKRKIQIEKIEDIIEHLS